MLVRVWSRGNFFFCDRNVISIVIQRIEMESVVSQFLCCKLFLVFKKDLKGIKQKQRFYIKQQFYYWCEFTGCVYCRVYYTGIVNMGKQFESWMGVSIKKIGSMFIMKYQLIIIKNVILLFVVIRLELEDIMVIKGVWFSSCLLFTGGSEDIDFRVVEVGRGFQDLGREWRQKKDDYRIQEQMLEGICLLYSRVVMVENNCVCMEIVERKLWFSINVDRGIMLVILIRLLCIFRMY